MAGRGGDERPLRSATFRVAGKEREMTTSVARLTERIRLLKTDLQSTKDWRRLRIEIEKRGGRWVAENGVVYELHEGVIYQALLDRGEGVTEVTITGLDAPEPFVAELDMDLQGTPPDKRAALIRELVSAATRAPKAKCELVWIIPGDWLSKIALARWGTTHWQSHLRPTEMTLNARKAKGKAFNPDLIYPGDTFEVIR